jgi:hypothetical protein
MSLEVLTRNLGSLESKYVDRKCNIVCNSQGKVRGKGQFEQKNAGSNPCQGVPVVLDVDRLKCFTIHTSVLIVKKCQPLLAAPKN